MPIQYPYALTSAAIPQLDRRIVTAAGNHRTISAESHSPHQGTMPVQHLPAFTGTHLPRAHRSIFATPREQRLMRAESNCSHQSTMPVYSIEPLAHARTPYP